MSKKKRARKAEALQAAVAARVAAAQAMTNEQIEARVAAARKRAEFQLAGLAAAERVSMIATRPLQGLRFRREAGATSK